MMNNYDSPDPYEKTPEHSVFLNKLAIVANKRDLTEETDSQIDQNIRDLFEEEYHEYGLEKSKF